MKSAQNPLMQKIAEPFPETTPMIDPGVQIRQPSVNTETMPPISNNLLFQKFQKTKNITEQFTRDTKITKNDYTKACYELAHMYAGTGNYGLLQIQHSDKAEYFFKEAIKHNYLKAKEDLLSAYLTGGIGCISDDYSKWLELSLELAKEGEQIIAFVAGTWFTETNTQNPHAKFTIPKDSEYALLFFRLASRGPDEYYARTAIEQLTKGVMSRLGSIVQHDQIMENIISLEQKAKNPNINFLIESKKLLKNALNKNPKLKISKFNFTLHQQFTRKKN